MTSCARWPRGKHGGDLRRIELDGVDILEPAPVEDILALDEALSRLAAEDPTKKLSENRRNGLDPA
jgi:hypothetical protein